MILGGSAHAQFIFDTEQGTRLMQEILEFLSEPRASLSLSPEIPLSRLAPAPGNPM